MRIRTMKWIFLVGLAGCSVPPISAVSQAKRDEVGQPSAVSTGVYVTEKTAQSGVEPRSFTGQWQACGGASSPDECSQYVLIQRGDKICGTWSYFATGDSYSGRVMARATSATNARRLRVCGRPGSETRTTCEVGWERINKPLRLCAGRLADLDGESGACSADFERVAVDGSEVVGLSKEAWVEACLADDVAVGAP